MGLRACRRRLRDGRRVLVHLVHGLLDILPIETLKGRVQVSRDAEVVHHEPVVLLGILTLPAVREAAVDPGDGLQEGVLPKWPIEVKRLLHGRIKACEQHVDHDEHLRLALRVEEGADYLTLIKVPHNLEFRAVIVGPGYDGNGIDAEAIEALGVAEGGTTAGRDDLGL